MSSGVGSVDNLATLSTLDEHSLMEELHVRYSRGIIYTYIGDILISLNPYANLPIYDSPHLFKYTAVKIQSDVPPHIFAIADKAYQNMRRTSTNQCCIVSGESGAGKTESTKFLVQQIAHLCNYTSGNLQEKILLVNPLLEAFGNAVTVMNNNSSRFGKYIELKFDPDGSLLGVHIFEYLLESTRVLSHGEEESNFHMFYYMFAGLYEKQLKDNLLNSPDDHRILRKADGKRVFENPQEFEYYEQMWDQLRQTMDVVGFGTPEVDGILAVLAAVLHISDISFETDDETDGVCIPNEDPLEMAALLLAVPAEMLATALISKVTHLRGEEIVTLKDHVGANDGRDALVKTLYSRLFGWIVRQINVMLQPDTKRHMAGPSIGILDMAGFENFETNSFEQLCINATNEQLQYYFNQQVFQWEMDEYKREGVKAKDIKYTDNRPLVDLFLENPIGFFSLLDEESRFPKATDLSLLEKLSKNLTKKQLFQRPKGNALFFTINHYAGPVTYDARRFLEKNRDTLSWNLLNLMKDSDSQFVSDLFHASITDTGSLYLNSNTPKRSRQSILLCKAPELSGSGTKSLSKQAGRRLKARARQTQGTPIYENAVRTQGAKFKNSLTDLMGKLLDAGPHFVRCIKPNADKHPQLFQTKLVQQQLKYTGVMETIRIRRQGYATRLPFEVFFSRYRFIAFKTIDKVDPSIANCTKIMKKSGLKDFDIGKSKIFLKYYHVERLNLVLDKNLWSVIKCQSVARGYIDRLHVRWLHKASMQDKADLRAFLGHVARDMDELYRSLSHQESHDRQRHEAMIQEKMMQKTQQAQQAQSVLRQEQSHARQMSHAQPMSHARPMSNAPPVSSKPLAMPDDEYLQRKPKKLIYQATPILLGNPVTGNPNPVSPGPGAANSRATYMEYGPAPSGQPEGYLPSPRGDLPLGDPRGMTAAYHKPDNGQYGQWHPPPGEYPTYDQRAPPFTALRPGTRRSNMPSPSHENEYPTESMMRPVGPSNYDYDNTTHYANPSTLSSPAVPAPVMQQTSQLFLERHLVEAIAKWPQESMWLKVLYIERSQVIANVNVGGSELIIDDSKQLSTSNVIGLRAFSNPNKDPATEKVLKKIGKGVKITRDSEGNIYAKQLSKSDIIMKGYKYPENGCLSSEVNSNLGRLSKHPLKIFDMSKFKSHISTELRNTEIDQHRLMRLCMINFAFYRNVFNDLETPCWVCLINYVALKSFGTDKMLDAVKESCNIRLTETEDTQMRRNWQQVRCDPGSYGTETMPPQGQFDAVHISEPDMAWHGYGNGVQHPSRLADNTGGSSDTPVRLRSNSPGYADSIPYAKYEGQPKQEKRREWAKLARKRDDY